MRIGAVWSVYVIRMKKTTNFASLGTQNVPSENPDQATQMLRLIRFFSGRTFLKVCFSHIAFLMLIDTYLSTLTDVTFFIVCYVDSSDSLFFSFVDFYIFKDLPFRLFSLL